MAEKKDKGHGSLRDWACPSYSAEDGRPVSSIGMSGGGTARSGATQVPSYPAHSSMEQSQKSSADPHRNKWGGSHQK